MEILRQTVKIASIDYLDKTNRKLSGPHAITIYDSSESNLSVVLDFVENVIRLDSFTPTREHLHGLSENNPGIRLRCRPEEGGGKFIAINIKTIDIRCIQRVCTKTEDTDVVDQLFCSIEEQDKGCDIDFLTEFFIDKKELGGKE